MNINEKQARYIFTILNEGSISAAARKLFISQPSLSQTLKQVETELGLPIFDRSKDPLSLTPAGACYIDAAHRVLSLTDGLERSVRELKRSGQDVIHFGIPVQRGLELLPRLIPPFHKLYPNVQLSLMEQGSSDLHEALRRGEVDLAVLTVSPQYEELHYILLDEEALVLLCDRSTRLAKRIPEGTPISIVEAKDECFVSGRAGHNINAAQEELFAMYGISPDILCASSNISNCQRIAVHSGAVMLCPDSYIVPDSEITKKGAVYPISDSYLKRSCYLCYRRDLPLNKHLRAFINLIVSMKKKETAYRPVSVGDMMLARDRRVMEQQEMLRAYHTPLIMLTLNIPGKDKVFEGISYAFFRGCTLIEEMLSKHRINIIRFEKRHEATGFEACFAVSADAVFLKRLLCEIEEENLIGRLFDIDVIKPDGEKVSRIALGLPQRRCLLCDEPAHACSRSRRHTVEELVAEIKRILYLDFLTESARHAILAEVYTTPKPGLVDRHDSGVHQDMCCETFEKSTAAILPYLTKMAEESYDYGIDCKQEAPDFSLLFQKIRAIGVDAEEAMFRATGGVNTHRGMIFTIGILMSAAAFCHAFYRIASEEMIFSLCRDLTGETLRADFENIDRKAPKTHGEALYIKHGYRGIRGEAADGFPSVEYIGLPAYRAAKKRRGENEIDPSLRNMEALLSLMTKVYDTTVLHRSSYEALLYMQKTAAELLQKLEAGMTDGELSHRLYEMNLDYIKRGISPGGCADLLAATIFVDRLREYR